MAHVEAHCLQETEFYSFTPSEGKDWFIYDKDQTNVILQAGTSLKKWDMAVLAIPIDSDSKSSDDFLTFIKAHRLQFKPNEKLLKSNFVPCQRFGKFCIKYEFKMKVHFILGEKEGDYILKSQDYDFIHPTRPDMRINVAFSELNEPGIPDD